MPTLAPPTERTQLRRLLRRRDDLADLIAARRSHGLPLAEEWVALVRLEDHLRETYPRAYTIHLPAWLQRRAPGAHPVGGHHPACPLCRTGTAKQTIRTGRTR